MIFFKILHLIKCPSFQKFQIEIYSHAYRGDTPIKTPFQLNIDNNFRVILYILNSMKKFSV